MHRNRWKYGVTAAGFSGITGQVILLRQLEVLFGGNELSLGIFFAAWLLWSGMGAWVAGKLLKSSIFYLLLFLQGLLLLISLWVFRGWPVISGRETGVIAGIADMLTGGIILVAPFALVTGALFTMGIKISGVEPRRIYFYEAVGAGLGGVFTVLLLGKIGIFQFGFLIMGVNTIIAASYPALQSITAFICLICFIWMAPLMERSSLKLFWKDFTLVKHAESVYSDIAITRMEEQYGVFQNGLLSFSFPDPLTAEESVHFPLLIHPHPRDVFLIGSGFSGAVDEILEHPTVEKVYYAEIDGRLMEIVKEIFPPEAVEFMNNPRVQVVNRDGRGWIKKCGLKFDVIIIALPDPSTAQLNRYYSEEFFRETADVLNPGGVLGFSLNSSEDYIEQSLAELIGGIEFTLERVFPYTVLLPGAKCYFIAGNRPLQADTDTIVSGIFARGIEADYISPYYLPYRLSAEKRDYLHKSIQEAGANWVNRDFHPQGYIRVIARWNRQFHPKWKLFHAFIWKFDTLKICLVMVILTFLWSLGLKGSVFYRGIKLGVAFGGMGQIGMQLMLLFGFQSIFGYIYYQQAILITAFMVGAAGGSYFAGRWKRKDIVQRVNGVIRVQWIILFLPLLIFGLLWIVINLGSAARHLLTLGAFICGWMGGLQYGLASSCLKGAAYSAGGRLYAMDLVGSSAGALVTGLLLIPLLGFLQTAVVLGFASLIPLMLMITTRKNTPIST